MDVFFYFFRENPINMNDLGVPLWLRTPPPFLSSFTGEYTSTVPKPGALPAADALDAHEMSLLLEQGVALGRSVKTDGSWVRKIIPGIQESDILWDFLKWGYPHSWMVKITEHPMKMDDDVWGTPISGNPMETPYVSEITHFLIFDGPRFIGTYWLRLSTS